MPMILVTWLLLLVVFTCVGNLVTRRLAVQVPWMERVLASFWAGWCLVIAFLQIWHFFFKINLITWVPIALTAACGAILFIRDSLPMLRQNYQPRSWRPAGLLVGLVTVSVVCLWFANHALVPSTLFDSLAYHMQTVMWNSLYPVVRGLGNLQERFAFNNSSFLYSALTDVGPWNQRSYHVSNTLLIVVLALQGLVGVYRLITSPERRAVNLFRALSTLPAILVAFDVFFVTFSPDIPILVLGFVLLAHLLALLLVTSDWPETRFHLLMILLVGFAGLTVKISFAGLAAPAILLALVITMVERSAGGRALGSLWAAARAPLGWAALIGALFIVPWVARGVVLSGYPFFPLALFGLPVEWRMTEFQVIDTNLWIQSWARLPGPHWMDVLSSNDWFARWLEKLPDQVNRMMVIFSVGTLLAAFLTLARRHTRRWRPFLFLITPLVGLIFWFASAPDVRFAGASLWALAFGACALVFHAVDQPDVDRFGLRGLAILGLVGVYLAPGMSPWIMPYTTVQPDPVEFDLLNSRFQSKATLSGLELRVPDQNKQCWKVKLPCMANFNSNLALIDPNELGKGFRIDVPSDFLEPSGFTATGSLRVLTGEHWYGPSQSEPLTWMATPARFAFYSDAGGRARLTFRAGAISDGERAGSQSRLEIWVNQKPAGELDLIAGQNTWLEVNVKRGFNVVLLSAAAGNFIPSAVDPNSSDDRPHAVGFEEINIEILK